MTDPLTTDENKNPYCMICGRHLGKPFHETNEHGEARRLAEETTTWPTS